MKCLRSNNQAATLLVVAGLAAFAAGCENDLAGAAASADVSADGDGGGDCPPCPEGYEGPYESVCCPLKTGGEPFDPCFGSCGVGTMCDSKTQKCVVCDDGDVCTDNGYDANTKKCTVTPNSAQCEDGDKCTVGDTCAASKCVGGPTKDCTDGNACTLDTCNPTTGCVHTPNDAFCDDGNVCMGGDKCVNGACVAGTPLSGGGCDDGNAGTVGDVCVAGVCKGSVQICNDNNACTVDLGNPPGCTYTILTCNDNKECTDDACDPAMGCKFVDNTATCSDNNACTTNDKCSGGACLAGTPTTCDDGKVCTVDSCNSVTGCVNAPVPNCSLLGEVCGNGVDDDGDGTSDCADTECVGASDAYTLHTFAPGGGTISIIVAGGFQVEFPLPAQTAGPDGVFGSADDVGAMFFTFACQEIPFAAKISGAGQTVVWVASVSYNQQGQPMFGGPPPASWMPAFWWPWVGPVALNPGVPPAVVGQASFEIGQGGSLLVRWPPAQ